jgi:hypothetical protein
MLSSALSALPSLRSGRVSDDEYVVLGRRSNSEELGRSASDDLFGVLRDGESLDDVLEVPFALARIKDVHAAMQLAVASAGDQRDDLTGHTLFYPAFAAFVLGFSIGLVTMHRAKLADKRGDPSRLAKRTQELCEEWGIAVALFYLVKVEASGIVDRETDQLAYGIENQWRLVADEKRMDAFEVLPELVAEGKRAGESWFHDESVEMGATLTGLLERFVSTYPGRVFN